MTIVVDASSVAAALIDGGRLGTWAADLLATSPLAAPHLLPVEVAGTLRRAVLAGDLTPEIGAIAHADLLDLRLHLFPYEPFAERVWDLRDSVTSYDAWYVALAEELDVPLATLDQRLVRSHGPRCQFLTPPG